MTPKERMAIPPQEMPQQDPAVRAHNMNEVALGYTAEMAKCEASRCMQCAAKPCMQGCPVAINIPGFLAGLDQDAYISQFVPVPTEEMTTEDEELPGDEFGIDIEGDI